MPTPYTKLAPVYDAIGASDSAMLLIPRILDYVLARDWLGKKVVELGCGTGRVSEWLSEQTYTVIGLDTSEDMLNVARKRTRNVEWEQTDARQAGGTFSAVDLALAFDLVNEMENIREVQALFQSVYQMLDTDALFVFDLYTLEGLAQLGAASDGIRHDEKGVLVVEQTDFDYERMACKQDFTVMIQQGGGVNWQRLDATRTLRGFQLQAVIGLLQRATFREITPLDVTLRSPGTNATLDRLVVIAKK